MIVSLMLQKKLSQAGKQIAKKAVTETGNRITQKAINIIIPPSKGKGLDNKSKAITEKYGLSGAIPIEQFVKS